MDWRKATSLSTLPQFALEDLQMVLVAVTLRQGRALENSTSATLKVLERRMMHEDGACSESEYSPLTSFIIIH